MSLAGQGCHVLRFDYFGCGDSGGDGEQATIDQSLSDLSAAVEELKDTSGVPKVSLVGLRMGAMLAALTASRRQDIDRIVLWDPVLDGGAYLDALRELHASWLRDRLGTVVHDPAVRIAWLSADRNDPSAAGRGHLTPLPALRAKAVADGL